MFSGFVFVGFRLSFVMEREELGFFLSHGENWDAMQCEASVGLWKHIPGGGGGDRCSLHSEELLELLISPQAGSQSTLSAVRNHLAPSGPRNTKETPLAR